MRISLRRIMALNSCAIRLPNALLGSKIRLPIGRLRSIQLIDRTSFYEAGWATFDRQNKFFRCRQRRFDAGQAYRLTVATGARSGQGGLFGSRQNFAFVLAAGFPKVHSRCFGAGVISLGAVPVGRVREGRTAP